MIDILETLLKHLSNISVSGKTNLGLLFNSIDLTEQLINAYKDTTTSHIIKEEEEK